MKVYGTKEPPVYNLSNINFPTHLFVGNYDRLADLTDAKRLFNEIGSKQKVNNLYNTDLYCPQFWTYDFRVGKGHVIC